MLTAASDTPPASVGTRQDQVLSRECGVASSEAAPSILGDPTHRRDNPELREKHQQATRGFDASIHLSRDGTVLTIRQDPRVGVPGSHLMDVESGVVETLREQLSGRVIVL